MKSENRRTVIWWGVQPPRDISRELENRKLTLVAAEEDEAVLRREMRAVLLPHYAGKGSDAISARARRLRSSVGDRGGSLFVVGFGETDRRAIIGQTAELPDVAVLDGTAASDVAEACARLEVGPAVGECTVVLEQGTDVSEQDKLLLRRAFSEYRQIRVRELEGGLSGARVWSLHAVSVDGRTTNPFLVKADTGAAITSEINTMKNFVVDHVPFANHPGLVEDRCVSGTERRLLVSRFLERATRLDDYLSQGRPVETIAAGLFQGAMRRWRSNWTRSRIRSAPSTSAEFAAPEIATTQCCSRLTLSRRQSIPAWRPRWNCLRSSEDFPSRRSSPAKRTVTCTRGTCSFATRRISY